MVNYDLCHDLALTLSVTLPPINSFFKMDLNEKRKALIDNT